MTSRGEGLEASGTTSSAPDRGYLFITCGKRSYRDEAAASARSIKRVDPRAHISLVSDTSPEGPEDESWKSFDTTIESPPARPEGASASAKEQVWKSGLLYKVRNLYRRSPYPFTFFADSDTYFLEDCSPLFDLLEYFDICVAQAPGDQSLISCDGKELVGYTPYNTGVILFRKSERVQRFFEEWERCYIENFETYKHDQPALMQALLHSDCRVHVLQSVWNARFPKYERFSGRVRLLHGRHADLERIARSINRTTGSRVWIPGLEACFSDESNAGRIWRVIRGAAGAPLRRQRRR